MEALLSAEEARVLGALLEKSAATPDHYPLTLNALRLACNQTSSRDPIVDYDEAAVEAAIAGLREKRMARVILSSSNRSAKYRHVLEEKLGLDAPERAVICLLLLRGPQTVAELRTRGERLFDFESLGEVEDALRRLGEREGGLVRRQERLPGQKEARYAELLSEAAAERPPGAATGSRAAPRSDLAERVGALEAAVAELHDEVTRLRRELGDGG